MDSLFVDYLNRLEAMHQGAKEAITGLPPEALAWVPGPEMNSFTVLVVHLAGSERFWVGEMAGQELAGRVRPEEFAATGLTEAELVQRLDESLAHSQQVLSNLLLTDLDKMHMSSVHGDAYRVSWSLMHNLEHVALHVGHMQIMRQMWQMGNG
ncbi:MAG: DUF664 domain-containing protein [Anaerolineae bacterium]|nr:DUF664 domain-containing protein [Anaerolineae bacterium]